MSDQETAKKTSTTSKAMFTKARNNMLSLIDSGSDVEIIESRFNEVKRTYLNVQEKHEEYLGLRGIEEANTSDQQGWVEVIDKEYDEAEELKVTYIRNKGNVEYEDRKKLHAEELKNTQRQALSIRRIEEAAFLSQMENLQDLVKLQLEEDDPVMNVVKDGLSDDKRQIDICKKSQHNHITTFSEIPQFEIEWITSLQDKLFKVTLKVGELTKKKEEKDSQRSGLRLQKIKMPSFDGDIRDVKILDYIIKIIQIY